MNEALWILMGLGVGLLVILIIELVVKRQFKAMDREIEAAKALQASLQTIKTCVQCGAVIFLGPGVGVEPPLICFTCEEDAVSDENFGKYRAAVIASLEQP